MRAVVSRVELNEPLPASAFEDTDRLAEKARAIEGFESIHLVQLDGALALLIVADSDATLDRIAEEVGSLWMREHVVPLAAGPPDRRLGDVMLSI